MQQDSGRRNAHKIAHTTLEEHFHDAVLSAAHGQQPNITEDSLRYLIGLLIHFHRADHLFDRTRNGIEQKPLAMLYTEAMHSQSPASRLRALRRLGDVSLFVSGFFSDSLNRKVVDIDYYISMGSSAYGSLSEQYKGTVSDETLPDIFNELAEKFVAMVDVLAEVSSASSFTNDSDVLRLYEVWLRTGSIRAAKKLRELGIEPNNNSVSPRHH